MFNFALHCILPRDAAMLARNSVRLSVCLVVTKPNNAHERTITLVFWHQ